MFLVLIYPISKQSVVENIIGANGSRTLCMVPTDLENLVKVRESRGI